MAETLTHAALKAKQRALRADFPETMGLRVHRSISWIGRAETTRGDHDAQFLFLWIAYNAAYADEGEFRGGAPSERATFGDFFTKIVALDGDQRIYKTVWESFSGLIRMLMRNRYVFNPFWQHHNGVDGFENWEERFATSTRGFAHCLQAQDTARILSFVFDRLYVLRNQLMHGGSTWNSAVNREQVRGGAAILGFLLPVFVDEGRASLKVLRQRRLDSEEWEDQHLRGDRQPVADDYVADGLDQRHQS